jgi:hypothetical protein
VDRAQRGDKDQPGEHIDHFGSPDSETSGRFNGNPAGVEATTAVVNEADKIRVGFAAPRQ